MVFVRFGEVLEGSTREQAKAIKLGIFCYFFYTSVKIIDARIERQLSTDKTDLPDKFLTLEYDFATGTTQWLHAPNFDKIWLSFKSLLEPLVLNFDHLTRSLSKACALS